MTGELADKVVVVTGGSRGIGRAIVLGAVERGARVAFCARRIDDAAKEVLEAAAKRGGDGAVIAEAADVTREADVEALFDRSLEAFGRVDVAVNNAAIAMDDLLVRLSVAEWDEVIATNLTGPFLVARRAVQEFLAQGDGGSLVSVGSLSQNGVTSQASYSASKGGLQGLSRSIAKEYGRRGIRANVVVGGYVDTRLSEGIPDRFRRFLLEASPLRRAGDVSEIADAVLYLAGDRASFVNGESIHATGGLSDVPL